MCTTAFGLNFKKYESPTTELEDSYLFYSTLKEILQTQP